jgi:hypothetical protein
MNLGVLLLSLLLFYRNSRSMVPQLCIDQIG